MVVSKEFSNTFTHNLIILFVFVLIEIVTSLFCVQCNNHSEKAHILIMPCRDNLKC